MDTGSLVEAALWTVVVLLGGYIVYRVYQIGAVKPTIMSVPTQPQEPKKVVELRDYTAAELATYNGVDASKPILLSVKSKIYDVSSGRSFYGPGGGYHVFAGKECARALATMSTAPKDVGIASVEGLAADDLETLDQWISKFESKYPHVGALAQAKN